MIKNAFNLAKKNMRINYSLWNHYSAFIYALIGIIIGCSIQILTKQSISDNEYAKGSDLFVGSTLFGCIMTLFFIYIFCFGWILYDNSGREAKTGEIIRFFSSTYTRKEVFLAKWMVIMIEFNLFILISLITIILTTIICIYIRHLSGFHIFVLKEFIEYIFFYVSMLYIFGFALYIPIFLFISYKFQTYWFTVFLIGSEVLNYLFLLVPLIRIAILSHGESGYSYLQIKTTRILTLGIGSVSIYFLPLFMGSLIVPKHILNACYIGVVLGFLPGSNTYYSQSEIIGFSIYSVCAIIFGILFLYFSQKHILNKKWLV